MSFLIHQSTLDFTFTPRMESKRDTMDLFEGFVSYLKLLWDFFIIKMMGMDPPVQ